MCVQSPQSCSMLYNLMDRSLSGSSVHGILQARILEWVAMPSSRWGGSWRSEEREETVISWDGGHGSGGRGTRGGGRVT